jgi:hypothetical protein
MIPNIPPKSCHFCRESTQNVGFFSIHNDSSAVVNLSALQLLIPHYRPMVSLATDLEIRNQGLPLVGYHRNHETRLTTRNAKSQSDFDFDVWCPFTFCSHCQVTVSLLWALHRPSMLHITVNMPMVPDSITQSNNVKYSRIIDYLYAQNLDVRDRCCQHPRDGEIHESTAWPHGGHD